MIRITRAGIRCFLLLIRDVVFLFFFIISTNLALAIYLIERPVILEIHPGITRDPKG